MDLRMGASKSVPPDRRQAILHHGLLKRRAELRRNWRSLITPECLEQLGATSAKVSSFLSGPDAFQDWRTGPQWTHCYATLAECLIAIGLGETIAYDASTEEPPVLSCVEFKRLSTQARVQALSVRYRCPRNIGVESESELAEELLRQLMVRDRTKLKAGSEFEAEDVLLKLNLVAVCAGVKRDLRLLDALNYYYELPHRSLARLRRNPQLLAAWLCIYAQLLCTSEW
jgi:hypothetical protein